MPFDPLGRYKPDGWREYVRETKRPSMRITENLTRAQAFQELDWRSVSDIGIGSDEIQALVKVLSGSVQVNPNGYGDQDDSKDRLNAIRVILTAFLRQITSEHIFTHKSIHTALSHFVNYIEDGNLPSEVVLINFLTSQSRLTFTQEDLEAATQKAYEEGYEVAKKDLQMIEKSIRKVQLSD